MSIAVLISSTLKLVVVLFVSVLFTDKINSFYLSFVGFSIYMSSIMYILHKDGSEEPSRSFP